MYFNKKYKSIKQLSDEYNINPKTIYTRLNRGYTIEDAVTITKEETKQHSLNNLSHIKLNKQDVINRMRKYGYEIIDYTYENNQSRMLCYDSEGYKVYMSITCAETGAQAQRFSTFCNEDNFLYNVKLYAKLNNYNCTVENYRPAKRKNFSPDILCTCSCGNKFWRNFNFWKTSKSDKCLKCGKISSKYENKVEDFLLNKNILYIKQKRFKDCRNKKPLPFDFYLPQYNCCIEVDGEQHFNENIYFSYSSDKEVDFKLRIKLDNIKTDYCKKNNIILLRIPYWEFDENETYKKSILNILNI